MSAFHPGRLDMEDAFRASIKFRYSHLPGTYEDCLSQNWTVKVNQPICHSINHRCAVLSLYVAFQFAPYTNL